jgi:hypothetical protein
LTTASARWLEGHRADPTPSGVFKPELVEFGPLHPDELWSAAIEGHLDVTSTGCVDTLKDVAMSEHATRPDELKKL